MAVRETPKPESKTQKSTRTNLSAVDHYFKVLHKVSEPEPQAPAETFDVNKEIARSHKLRNDNAEQDIALKRSTLKRLFRFLIAETCGVFVFALFQAIHWPAQFHLDEWSFNLLVTATITQITGMLFVAVRYLFPTPKDTKDES